MLSTSRRSRLRMMKPQKIPMPPASHQGAPTALCMANVMDTTAMPAVSSSTPPIWANRARPVGTSARTALSAPPSHAQKSLTRLITVRCLRTGFMLGRICDTCWHRLGMIQLREPCEFLLEAVLQDLAKLALCVFNHGRYGIGSLIDDRPDRRQGRGWRDRRQAGDQFRGAQGRDRDEIHADQGGRPAGYRGGQAGRAERAWFGHVDGR